MLPLLEATIGLERTPLASLPTAGNKSFPALLCLGDAYFVSTVTKMQAPCVQFQAGSNPCLQDILTVSSIPGN